MTAQARGSNPPVATNSAAMAGTQRKEEIMMYTCPSCGHRFEAVQVPPEPPVGTWIKDRHGGVTYRQHDGSNGEGGWAPPGFMPFASWAAMWAAHGPLVECGPWGREKEEPTVRYPDITVELVGEDGNAFSIIGAVRRALRRANVPHEEVSKFQDEAMSGDYDHLLQTAMRWVNVE